MQITRILILAVTIIVMHVQVCMAGDGNAVVPGLGDAFVAALREHGMPAVNFKAVCSTTQDANNICVTAFSEVQVQPFTALGLVKEWALEKKKHKIICSPVIRKSSNDDYIKCVTPDNKVHYEFKFDDVFETKDSTIFDGKKEGLRQILNAYNNMGTGYVTVVRGKRIQSIQECGPLRDMAEKFALAVSGHSKRSAYLSMEEDPPYCHVTATYGPPRNDLNGLVDNTVFKTLQSRLNFDLEAVIGGYVGRSLKKNNIQMDKFWCDYGVRQYKGPEVLKTDNDDVLRCFVKVADRKYVTPSGVEKTLTGNGTYTIEFLFDDLSEAWDTYNDAAKSAMECVSSTDGVFDGRRCVGISRTDCLKLKSDVEWDPDTQMCVLTAANTAANIKRVGEVASSVGAAAGVVALTIVTGGSTTVVLLAVAGVATTVGSEVVVSSEREYIAQFTNNLSKCTSRACFKRYFNEFLTTGSNYVDNLTDDQIAAIDRIMANMIDKFANSEEDKKALVQALQKANSKGIIDRCISGTMETVKCGLDTATIILDFLPIAHSVKGVRSFLTKCQSGMGTKMPKTANSIINKMRALRDSSATVRTTAKVAVTTSEAYGKLESAVEVAPVLNDIAARMGI